jgi:hypothetical protein
MRFPGFIGPSYTLSSVNYDCQRTLNMYPEFNELRTGKEGEVEALIGTPGLALLAAIGSGPIRGMWFTSTGLLFVVSGTTVYIVDSMWVGTSVGTLLTGSGPVGMADNGLQLVIVDGSNGYYITLPGGSVTQITDINFIGSNTVSFQDGYFIFVKPNSAQFYLSDLNAVTFNAPANTAKNGFSDNIVRHECSNRNLWLLGDQTTEVWFNAGTNNNPFQYISGSMSHIGCVSSFAVTKMANTIFWLGKDQTGDGIVYMANGYAPQRISNSAVELAFSNYSTLTDAISYSYQENGHQFFVLTFPTASATWCYDTLTGMWHERAYNNGGALIRHRSNCYAFAYSTHVVGDYSNGNIYNLSPTTYTDNGTAIIRQRVTPHISKDMDRVFYNSFQLDFESAIGLDGSGQGTSPQAILQWSNDGGHTWSNEHWAQLCPIGAMAERTIWRRLGQSRNRVFKVTISDPIKVVMFGAELELRVGAA